MKQHWKLQAYIYIKHYYGLFISNSKQEGLLRLSLFVVEEQVHVAGGCVTARRRQESQSQVRRPTGSHIHDVGSGSHNSLIARDKHKLARDIPRVLENDLLVEHHIHTVVGILVTRHQKVNVVRLHHNRRLSVDAHHPGAHQLVGIYVHDIDMGTSIDKNDTDT
jgi:hypothetical protein